MSDTRIEFVFLVRSIDGIFIPFSIAYDLPVTPPKQIIEIKVSIKLNFSNYDNKKKKKTIITVVCDERILILYLVGHPEIEQEFSVLLCFARHGQWIIDSDSKIITFI